MGRLASAFFMLWLSTSYVLADEIRPGYLQFDQLDEQRWQLTWRFPTNDFIRPDLTPTLPKACRFTEQPLVSRDLKSMTSKAGVHCTGSVEGELIGYQELNSSQSEVYLRVAKLGEATFFDRLTPSRPLSTIPETGNKTSVASTYLLIGAEHILLGYDHLLFVVALVILLGKTVVIIKAATAFTIAHSITLIGTSLGFVGLPQSPVEAVIALSIVLLAVEIRKKDQPVLLLSKDAPGILAFCFGLIHGFGFAGALNEIGLPPEDITLSLLAFNVGVEVGQLLIILMTVGVLAVLKRYAPALKHAVVTTSTYAIGSVGAYWFLERTVL